MMNKNQMADKLHQIMCNVSYDRAIALVSLWCKETGNGFIPPTPMSKWNSFVEHHADRLDWTKISHFSECDSYFYVDAYGLMTTDYLGDEFANASMFFDCINYWVEHFDRYNRAMAILNGDKYVVFVSDYEIYI